MEEEELISKIEKMKKIEPDKDWIVTTKQDIMGEETQGIFDKVKSVLSKPIKKPALVVSPLILLAALLGGLFVYSNFLPKNLTPSNIVKVEDKGNAEVVSSLANLQANLGDITRNLKSLKKVKNPKKALAISQIIKATASQGRDVIGNIKDKNGTLSKDLTKRVNNVYAAYSGLMEKASSTQAEILGVVIDGLENASLTDQEESRLQKARDYYNNNEYSKTLLFIQKINE